MVARAELSKPDIKSPSKPSAAPTPSKSSVAPTEGVTVEYQRTQAKEMTKYFKKLKAVQTAAQQP